MSFRGRLFTLILWVHVRACNLLLYWSKQAESALLLLPESVCVTPVPERLLEDRCVDCYLPLVTAALSRSLSQTHSAVLYCFTSCSESRCGEDDAPRRRVALDWTHCSCSQASARLVVGSNLQESPQLAWQRHTDGRYLQLNSPPPIRRNITPAAPPISSTFRLSFQVTFPPYVSVTDLLFAASSNTSWKLRQRRPRRRSTVVWASNQLVPLHVRTEFKGERSACDRTSPGHQMSKCDVTKN